MILVLESTAVLNLKQIEASLQKGTFSIDKEAWPDELLQMHIPRSGRQRKVDRNALREHLTKKQITWS